MRKILFFLFFCFSLLNSEELEYKIGNMCDIMIINNQTNNDNFLKCFIKFQEWFYNTDYVKQRVYTYDSTNNNEIAISLNLRYISQNSFELFLKNLKYDECVSYKEVYNMGFIKKYITNENGTKTIVLTLDKHSCTSFKE